GRDPARGGRLEQHRRNVPERPRQVGHRLRRARPGGGKGRRPFPSARAGTRSREVWRHAMRVRDVMSRNIETISAADPAQAAISRMVTRKIRHLPVVDADLALVGVVTDRDLRHYLFSPGVFERVGRVSSDELLKGATVKQVMSSPAVSIRADDPLETAARLMVVCNARTPE